MDNKLMDEIDKYWTDRALGYSKVNQEELLGMQKARWLSVIEDQIEQYCSEKDKSQIHILDIGTGPGFLAIILAAAGYQVTAVDYTEAMLAEAGRNAGMLADRIVFKQMDAQDLTFPRESFDMVISRNLTWVLEKPEKAYQSWYNVLKKGGLMLNFDANWYAYLYNDDLRKGYEQDRLNVEASGCEDHYNCTDIDAMEEIACRVPLSSIQRPEWDVQTLKQFSWEMVTTDLKIGESVWSPTEKVNYASTPMFMITARKLCQSENPKAYIADYWTKRSEGFANLRQKELHSEKYQRWEQEVLAQLPPGKHLKILDVGCGAGFFSILLARQGHQVIGIDLTENMIEEAVILAEEEGVKADFQVMDAEHLEFADHSFDVVISRNLTWNLPHPQAAYKQWMRVLKENGVLLNYDAEYARDHHAQKLPQNHAHDYVSDDLMNQCHNIYHMLDISTRNRPAWDQEVLRQVSCCDCDVTLDIGETVYKEQDMFYIPVPMFRIRAVKKG